MQKYYILAINPGSTSTKIAVFMNEKKILSETINHSVKDLSGFNSIMDQRDFRAGLVLDFLDKCEIPISKLSAIIGRGGMLTPMRSGTYKVNNDMVDFLINNLLEHASSLGAIIADLVAKKIGVKAYIVDPVVVDEMDPIAKITGIPEIRRVSIFHALNQKAAAREAAKKLKIKYREGNFIVAHLGGGITVGAHKRGKVVDVNNGLNGDGPFSPERVGSAPTWSIIEWATTGLYSLPELKKRITGKGGIVAHLGTNDMREVKARIENGDRKAERVYKAMAYNISKEIGAMAPVLDGKVNAVVITGGLAFDKEFVSLIKNRIKYISPVIVLPGEDEMAALAKGGLRVLRGEEHSKIWRKKETVNGSN
ncbi:MAG: butyrate kinase [Acidobacteriota bacterium]